MFSALHLNEHCVGNCEGFLFETELSNLHGWPEICMVIDQKQ